MKKTKKFRLFTVLIAMCMLVGTIPAYALNPYGSLTLTFTSEESIDLGGIEISVYQATPATVTEAYTLYNETFHSTVTTDENGTVTFAKPSQYCSITVELDSLPDGVGITKQTKFFNPDVTEQTVTLATVDRAETELSGTEIKPTFYSADNVQLLADYEVVMSDNTYATMPWESIDAMDSFVLSGIFVDGNMSVPYSIPLDVSEVNVVEKYKVLYDHGMISERDMVLRQCEVLTVPENAYMRSSDIMCAIEKYREKMEKQSVPIDSETIAVYAGPTANSDLTLIDNVLTYDISSSSTDWRSETVIASGTHAVVTSDLTYTADLKAFADAIVDEMDDIHTYFVTSADFTAPASTTGLNGRMAIEIVDNNHIDGENRSMYNVAGRTYGDGYILINYDEITYGTTTTRIVDRWKTTLAHEYQHAIQNTNATGYKDSWLSESTANFAAAMYANYISDYDYMRYIYEFKDSINAYNETVPTSLNETNYDGREYAFLFPAYLYFELGTYDWTIIEKLYEASFARPSTATPNIYNELDQALKSYNTTYSLKSAFSDFIVDNLFPKSSYDMLYPPYANWELPGQNIFSAEAGYASSTCHIDPMAANYNLITDLSDAEITITIQITEGSHSDLRVHSLARTNSHEKTTSPVNPINPTEHNLTGPRVTIQYYHGAPNHPNYNIIAINTSFTDEITYTISVSS